MLSTCGYYRCTKSPASLSILLRQNSPISPSIRLRNHLPPYKHKKAVVRDVDEEYKPLTTHCMESNVLMRPKVLPKQKMKNLPAFVSLTKPRLSTLVVMSTMAGYVVTASPFDPFIFSVLSGGTFLLAGAANAINQVVEAPYDAQMTRTRGRPLATRSITPQSAAFFAFSTAFLGAGMLYQFVNPLTAGLGLLNLVVYSAIYTPLKRISISNTWVGGIVGAIPPIMGVTAVTNVVNSEAILLGLILFAWQFPHFNSLSWNLRNDYMKAGYRMMASFNEALLGRTTTRYAYAIAFISYLLPFYQITGPLFFIASLPINLPLIVLSHRFTADMNAKTSRSLFRYTLFHLPALLIAMLLCSIGMGEKKQYGWDDALMKFNKSSIEALNLKFSRPK